MSIYGHTLIDPLAFKRWVNSLTVNDISEVDVAGCVTPIDGEIKKYLELQLELLKKLINEMEKDDSWRGCIKVLSPMSLNAFIRLDNSSIKIGDYYECFIVPSNLKTYKKIIKGFDYQKIGEVNINDDSGKKIATIGCKSDLIWLVFHGYFINENDDGSIDHVYANHEQIMSLQLYDVEKLSVDELKSRVTEILLNVSMKFDMDFKVYEVDSLMKEEGDASIIQDTYTPIGFEEIPMIYLHNANSITDERYCFLSYYQVIEYFFVRAQNYYFLDKMTSINQNNINHIELNKIIKSFKNYSSERETLKIVLEKAIDINDFKNWINSKVEFQETYCNSVENKIDLSKPDEKLIRSIAERVYNYRCSIAHAKGDYEEYMAIPMLCREKILAEIPLVRYLAYEVIKKWSE